MDFDLDLSIDVLGHTPGKLKTARVMAKEYGDQVGPWVAFLPVLTDHPAPRS